MRKEKTRNARQHAAIVNKIFQQSESALQISCVKYFRYKYPQYAKLFFAIPNGGSRNIIEASNMKRTGTLAGVADMILLIPKLNHVELGGDFTFTNTNYHALCLEFKTIKGKQSSEQKEFEEAVTAQSYLYKVIRTFDDFQKLITEYLS